MLIGKQIDRLVHKVQRLNEVYTPFLIKERIKPIVYYIDKNNKNIKVDNGFSWGEDFSVGSFKFITPKLDSNKHYYLSVNTGGVESQIIINNKKYGMTDYIENASEPMFRCHKYVLLDNLKEGDEVRVESYFSHTFNGTSPYSKPSTFSLDNLYSSRPYRSIELLVLNELLLSFIEKLELLNSSALSITDKYKKDLINNTYIRLYETLSLKESIPDDDSLINAIFIIDSFFNDKDNLPYIGIIGHSHLDTAWLWRISETRRKLHRTMSNAVTLLKRFPEYKFFLSTTLYLKWIEEDDTELFNEIKEFIKEGRIEPNGSTFVECDGNLIGAEALCRQFIRGKLYLREKFGYESDTFFLPDTFGYPPTLPQILKECGVKYFLTTKLSWNDTFDFPFNSFIWQGIDSSKVLVHFNSIQTYITDNDIKNRIDSVKNLGLSSPLLMAYGFGDGGGGPSHDMVSKAIYTANNIKTAKVEHTTVSNFMNKLSKNNLPTFSGELYLELHRGTYTTNHTLKKLNRRLEEALHNLELISVLNNLNNKDVTDKLYDSLLINQFHDILPGTCINEASIEAENELLDTLNKVNTLIKGDGKPLYYNTLGFDRVEYLESSDGISYIDLDGNEKIIDAYYFDIYNYETKYINNNKPISYIDNVIETSHYKIKLEEGKIKSLIYKGRELVGKDDFLSIKYAEDIPYFYDNWDIDADYKYKEKDAKYIESKVVLNSPNILILRNKYLIGDKSTLLLDLIFRNDTALIEFNNKLEFYDKHILVKSYFNTTIFTKHYNCDSQFGYIERNNYIENITDYAKFEVCSHKWTDVSEKNMGLSLLSDSKYGVSSIGNTLGLTLYKSGTHPDSRGGEGTSYFRYGIYPHDNSLSMDTIKEGYKFNNKPIITGYKIPKPFFNIKTNNSVILETVKYSESKGITMRFYESLGASENIIISFDTIKNISITNILEDERESIITDKIELKFSPFEIKTIIIK